jgi:hypothetical protein
VRAEGTNRNVAEELRVQENPEKWTELDFGRATATKKLRLEEEDVPEEM